VKPLVLLLVLAPIVSGCLGGTDLGVRTPAPTDLDPRVYVHDATGALLGDAPGLLPRFSLFDTGVSGAEPSLGVTSNGHIFYVAYEKVLRSSDHGHTWTQVSSIASSPQTLDPMLWVDPDTDRIFSDQLYVGCSWLSWSDDDGASWTTNPIACGTPVNDHQKIVAAKPRTGLPTVGYPKVVYYCYNGLEYSGCAASRTGGLTFEPARVIYGPHECDDGYSYVHGRIRAAADGTLYVPQIACGPRIAVSRDDGQTWRRFQVDGLLGYARDLVSNPDVAIDSEGNVYFAWMAKDAHIHLAVSRDLGETWSVPVTLTPPPVTSATKPSIVVGDAGRIGVAYWATTANTTGWKGCDGDGVLFARVCGEGPYAEYAPDSTLWHQWVTLSTNALEANATFMSTQVTPDGDPLQVGSIHLGGGSDPDRNLLDFIDAAMDAEGRFYLATADGCLPQAGCRLDDPSTSRSDRAMGASLLEGPSLLASVGVLAAPSG
jgi:hypothetical protein